MYKLMSLEVGLLVESLSTIRALERLGASVSEEMSLHVMFLNEKKNNQHISNKKNFAKIKCRTSKKSMPHSEQMNGRLSLCFRMCCFSWLWKRKLLPQFSHLKTGTFFLKTGRKQTILSFDLQILCEESSRVDSFAVIRERSSRGEHLATLGTCMALFSEVLLLVSFEVARKHEASTTRSLIARVRFHLEMLGHVSAQSTRLWARN